MTVRATFLAFYLVATAAAAAAVLAGGISLFAKRFEVGTRQALGAAAIAALPGVVFVQHSMVSKLLRSRVWAYDLASFVPAAFWVLMGPLFILWSFRRVRMFRLPSRIEALRFVLVATWLLSSLITTAFGLQV